MQASKRLGLAFLILITAFLVLAGFAVANLVLSGQWTLAMVVGVAAAAGVAAGVLTWRVLRRDEAEPLAAQPEAPRPQVVTRTALRVQSMPVADLPPAYVDAVTRGIRARTTALQGQAQKQAPELHH